MNIIPVEHWDTNPFFPLVKDYFVPGKYTQEELRTIRVNACRQWLRRDLPFDQMGECKVRTLRFFDNYYLHPDPDEGFDPLFYDNTPLETPAFHWDFLRLTGNPLNRCNLLVAPRGSAKSTGLVKKPSILELLSRPAYSICYATSSAENAEAVSEEIKNQLYYNARISDDFAKLEEFGGQIRPTRGAGKQGVTHFALTNRSWFRAVSAQSKLRGIRPRRFRLDDPEFDPRASTSMPTLRDYMDQLLFKVALPMVMRQDCGIDWCATFVTTRHYAWHAMAMQTVIRNDTQTTVALDERFEGWNRVLIRAAIEDKESKYGFVSCWPEMWPTCAQERQERGLPPTVATLEEIRTTIGPAAFASEYMGNPGASGTGESFFGTLTERKHGYTIHATDENAWLSPETSSARISWYRNETEEVSMPLNLFLKYVRLILTIDTSFTSKASSDYKAAAVLALTPENELFVLDLWAAKARETALVQASFGLADKWKVPSMHPEVVRGSHALYNALKSIVATRATDLTGTAHLPKIVGYNPGLSSKTDRIQALHPRFEHGKIKLPFTSRFRSPWRELFDQIDSFNPDAENGGLSNDDHLDVVQMGQYVFMGRPHDRRPTPDKPVVVGITHEQAVAALRRGDKKSPEGFDYSQFINLRRLTAEDIGHIQDATNGQASGSRSLA